MKKKKLRFIEYFYLYFKLFSDVSVCKTSSVAYGFFKLNENMRKLRHSISVDRILFQMKMMQLALEDVY